MVKDHFGSQGQILLRYKRVAVVCLVEYLVVQDQAVFWFEVCVSLNVGEEVPRHFPMSHIILPFSFVPAVLAIDRHIHSMPLVVAPGANKFQSRVLDRNSLSESKSFALLTQLTCVITFERSDFETFNLPY